MSFRIFPNQNKWLSRFSRIEICWEIGNPTSTFCVMSFPITYLKVFLLFVVEYHLMCAVK